MPFTKIEIEADAETALLAELRDLLVRVGGAMAETVDRDALRLLVTELAANSIEAGAHRFLVSMALERPDVLHVEVSDDGHGEVVPHEPDPSAETGRGLLIVDAMATKWGIRGGGHDGSTVWFQLDCRAVTTPSPGGDGPALHDGHEPRGD